MSRQRQIYSTDLLYVGPTGNFPVTGALYSNASYGLISGTITSGQSLIAELYRVQKCENGWDKKLKIVNQFGELGQLDLTPIIPPDVTLNFSYVQANLVNESLMGFTVNSSGDANQISCLSGILTNYNKSKNYFIKSTQEGTDAINSNPSEYDVISFGNTFLSSYSAQGRVLDFPTVDVSLVALNIQAQHIWQANTGTYAITPAIIPSSGLPVTGWGYILPSGVNSYNNAGLNNIYGISVLRPGDINLNLGLNAGDGFSLSNDMKIQSYNLSFNLGLEDLAQLGSKFYYAKLPKFPVEATLTVNALAGDFQTGSLVEIYNNNLSFNPSITINQPGTSNPVVFYQLRNAKLESQKYGLSIGSNKTVDLSFRTTIGSATDSLNGLFMSGINTYLPVNYISLFPIMTSNNTPAGIVTSSSVAGGTHDWAAFGNPSAGYWQSTTPSFVPPQWIQYQFASPHAIVSYTFTNAYSSTVIYDFALSGSNDGSTWSALDTETVVSINAFTAFNKNLSLTPSYSYFRLNFTNATSFTVPAISNFQIMGI